MRCNRSSTERSAVGFVPLPLTDASGMEKVARTVLLKATSRLADAPLNVSDSQ